ncbi:hypothetical protein ANCCEY_01832 [Ancylostoma ceylanicum]|uniref:Uncharacterized protein n=1 Tax=Ancylostoma ceylanicum TaxID=53326 RepID=A0A0D6M4K0_9BILA|nr:hypothetical protein ANCCEY_01832 [Ancylostoma ceylanicum]
MEGLPQVDLTATSARPMCDMGEFCSRYMKQQAEERFGNWWSAVIVGDRGGYGMSAVYDKYRNTSCEMQLFGTFYWLGRTC